VNVTDLAADVLRLVGDRAEAEVTAVSGSSGLTRFANSYIHQNVAEDAVAVALKVVVDGRVSAANTNNLQSESLARLVDATIEAARLQPVDEQWPGLSSPASVGDVDHYDEATAQASPAERADKVRKFVTAGEGMLAAGYCDTVGEHVAYANTNGHTALGRVSRATLDGIHQTPTSAGSAHAASVRLVEVDAAAAGALAADRARRSVGAFDNKPGEYEVVLAPECVASIAVFLGVYGFNAKTHQEGQSFVRLGEQQFDRRIDLVDDVTDPRALAVGFDSEGTVKRRVELVAAGVSSSLAHDRRTAARTGTESTGHGAPGSEVWGPIPSNMFVCGDGESVESMISSVERGLYVAAFNYCRVVEPKSLVVTGVTRNGTFMIENGRITGAVTNMRFTQSFVGSLGAGRVLGIGDDARHADSEFGPGMVHAPTLHLAAWNFTGGASG
jgi:predicted Zn-dependent protease